MYFKKTVGIEMLTEHVADRSLQREYRLVGLCLERDRIETNGDRQQYQRTRRSTTLLFSRVSSNTLLN